jgi:hypothetical protein
MENARKQNSIKSLHGASLLSSVLSGMAAAMVVAAALCLVPGVGISQTSLPGACRVALVVLVMMVGFSGVLVSTLLNLPDTLRRTLMVLSATALLRSSFVALVGWFAVSGATSCWCESQLERKKTK